MHERLTADGYKVGKRTELHVAWTFYIEASGRVMVEVLGQSGIAEMKAALERASG